MDEFDSSKLYMYHIIKVSVVFDVAYDVDDIFYLVLLLHEPCMLRIEIGDIIHVDIVDSVP